MLDVFVVTKVLRLDELVVREDYLPTYAQREDARLSSRTKVSPLRVLYVRDAFIAYS